MLPATKTGLRRIAICVTMGIAGAIGYVLHSYSGVLRAGLMLACFVSLGFAIQLLMDEGRERERMGRK